MNLAKLVAAAGALVLALTGCAGAASTSAAPDPSTSARAATTSPTTSVTAAAATTAITGGLQQACGTPLAFTEKTLATSADGGPLKAWTRGDGSTAVVLLHQTNNNASCGWVSKLNWLESQKVRVVLVDICGYGRSTCSLPWADQTKAAVDWAKGLGSSRVVLFGSSLGGTMALKAGPASGADALIDVSGPATFREGDLAVDAPKATLPTLLVYSPTDSADLAKARTALPTIPAAHKKLVETKTGHGFETLEAAEVRSAVEAWIAGTYA